MGKGTKPPVGKVSILGIDVGDAEMPGCDELNVVDNVVDNIMGNLVLQVILWTLTASLGRDVLEYTHATVNAIVGIVRLANTEPPRR